MYKKILFNLYENNAFDESSAIPIKEILPHINLQQDLETKFYSRY